MDMDVILLEKFRLHVILSTNGTNITDAGLCRLFHDISKLSGKYQISFARHYIDFNFKSHTANACPCKSTHNSNFILFILLVRTILCFTKILFKIAGRNTDFVSLLLIQLSRTLAADFSNPALKSTDTGLSRIERNHILQCLVSDFQLPLFDAILCELLCHEVILCNMELLVLRITAHLNNLHAIHQWSRNVLQGVCTCNKKHF